MVDRNGRFVMFPVFLVSGERRKNDADHYRTPKNLRIDNHGQNF